VEIAHSGRKWSRTVQITPGDVHIHGDIAEK